MGFSSVAKSSASRGMLRETSLCFIVIHTSNGLNCCSIKIDFHCKYDSKNTRLYNAGVQRFVVCFLPIKQKPMKQEVPIKKTRQTLNETRRRRYERRDKN